MLRWSDESLLPPAVMLRLGTQELAFGGRLFFVGRMQEEIRQLGPRAPLRKFADGLCSFISGYE